MLEKIKPFIEIVDLILTLVLILIELNILG